MGSSSAASTLDGWKRRESGHFYFGRKRTSVLCADTRLQRESQQLGKEVDGRRRAARCHRRGARGSSPSARGAIRAVQGAALRCGLIDLRGAWPARAGATLVQGSKPAEPVHGCECGVWLKLYSPSMRRAVSTATSRMAAVATPSSRNASIGSIEDKLAARGVHGARRHQPMTRASRHPRERLRRSDIILFHGASLARWRFLSHCV